MRRDTPALIVLSVIAFGCHDAIGPTREAPSFVIQDASHNNGSAHFYWSSPIVADPGRGGTFDPTYQPLVQVCALNGSECGTVVAEFRTGRGTGGATVKVDLTGERYHVNWHTGQCKSGPCVLDPAKTYRLRVLVGGLEAGFADVDVVSSRGEAKNVNTGEYIPLLDGTTLPIRFRIEHGLTLVNPQAAPLPALKRASQRYRDAGVKPGVGRDGAAVVAGRALLGSDGTTLLELTTGQLDRAGTAAGKFEKVQFKHLDASGEAVYTLNFSGLNHGGAWSHTLRGLPRGARLQLQGNVSGIDASRTSVVTVPVTVARRPDLEAKELALPATATPGVPTVITAVVAEKNGDVGATGDCRLYVDNILADEAPAIWVDAGDEVSCNFAHTFLQAGTYAVRVAIENVTPGDDVANNNAVTGSLSVASNTTVSNEAYARFQHDDFSRSWSSRWQFTSTEDPAFLYLDEAGGTEQVRRKHLLAWHQWWGTRDIAFPLASVRVVQRSGDAVSADYTLSNVAATYTNSWEFTDSWGHYWGHDSCYDAAAPDGQVGWVKVCSTAAHRQSFGQPVESYVQTWAYANSARGTTQYLARDFVRRIYTPTGEDYTDEALYMSDETDGGVVADPGSEMTWVLDVQGVEAGTGEALTYTGHVAEPWESSSWTEDGTPECFAGGFAEDVWVLEYSSCSSGYGSHRVDVARRFLW